MAKYSLSEKLHKRKINKPNFIYNVLGAVWQLTVSKKYNIHYHFKKDFRKEPGPYIVVSNHASRLDYMFTGIPLLPNRYNFVAGYNEFFRSHLSMVFKLLKVIPKKNFTSDIYTIRQVTNVLRNNGKIVIYPEGMSSISGANQPVAIGTGKFIKHFNLPVYYSVIKGGYLTCPKYTLDERPGYVEVEFDQLFSPEEIEKLSPAEIEDKLNQALYHDDYRWNKVHKHQYKTNGKTAVGLENLLYLCPKCHSEHAMISDGDVFKCSECGNGVIIDNTYEMHPLHENCVIPETQTAWFNYQRQYVKEQIKDPNFELQEKVKLGIIPDDRELKDQKTAEIVGEGIITLNHSGLTYKGTKNGEEFTFHMELKEVPTYGMCTDVSRFYTFYKNEFYEFYPENNTVEKWFLATEELHRAHGGKWKDFKFEK